MRQYRCAETEKYAHVTFFFNGGSEKEWSLEERCLVPSPKVATYDLQPEMSATGVADKVRVAIAASIWPIFSSGDRSNRQGRAFICYVQSRTARYGRLHGRLRGGSQSVRSDRLVTVRFLSYNFICTHCADTEIGRIETACKAHGYVLYVTSDHGNAEQMYDKNGDMHTTHTCNKGLSSLASFHTITLNTTVPFASTSTRRLKTTLPEREAALRDIAPTILAEMHLPIPVEMNGVSLLE